MNTPNIFDRSPEGAHFQFTTEYEEKLAIYKFFSAKLKEKEQNPKNFQADIDAKIKELKAKNSEIIEIKNLSQSEVEKNEALLRQNIVAIEALNNIKNKPYTNKLEDIQYYLEKELLWLPHLETIKNSTFKITVTNKWIEEKENEQTRRQQKWDGTCFPIAPLNGDTENIYLLTNGHVEGNFAYRPTIAGQGKTIIDLNDKYKNIEATVLSSYDKKFNPNDKFKHKSEVALLRIKKEHLPQAFLDKLCFLPYTVNDTTSLKDLKKNTQAIIMPNFSNGMDQQIATTGNFHVLNEKYQFSRCYFQDNTVIMAGSSGAPIVAMDENGKIHVIGMNNAVPKGGNRTITENVHASSYGFGVFMQNLMNLNQRRNSPVWGLCAKQNLVEEVEEIVTSYKSGFLKKIMNNIEYEILKDKDDNFYLGNFYLNGNGKLYAYDEKTQETTEKIFKNDKEKNTFINTKLSPCGVQEKIRSTIEYEILKDKDGKVYLNGNGKVYAYDEQTKEKTEKIFENAEEKITFIQDKLYPYYYQTLENFQEYRDLFEAHEVIVGQQASSKASQKGTETKIVEMESIVTGLAPERAETIVNEQETINASIGVPKTAEIEYQELEFHTIQTQRNLIKRQAENIEAQKLETVQSENIEDQKLTVEINASNTAEKPEHSPSKEKNISKLIKKIKPLFSKFINWVKNKIVEKSPEEKMPTKNNTKVLNSNSHEKNSQKLLKEKEVKLQELQKLPKHIHSF